MDISVDYLAPEAWDSAMHERLRWLRRNDPVHWAEKNQLWVVTKFADVAYVSKHHQLFCSGHGVRPGNPMKIGLIDEDEPRHGALRGLMNKGFTPRMIRLLEPGFKHIVTEVIDKVASTGACDFAEDIAVPIPLLLIAEMLGIRKEDRAHFHRWSDHLIAADGNLGNMEIMERARAAFIEYAAYVTEIIEDRRRHPREDLISILAGARDDGVLADLENPVPGENITAEHQRLANNELILLLVVLLVAGNETTRNGISGGMQLLIENPGERQKLIDDPSLIPAAVEEMVRMVSPVHTFGRTATQDTELRGRKIRKGQTVLLVYPSANRDADEFEDPDTFKVTRNPMHLGFGIGNHYCLGANLARMEMRVTFEELLRRLPDMSYAAGGPEIKPSPLVRSCLHMHVRYTPERA